MCFRMRAQGWRIWRLDAPMTRHDAALTTFGQWWQRARRTGHTYAQGAALHGSSPERYKRRELRRTLIWSVLVPLIALLCALLVTPWGLALLLIYPAQILRLARRGMPLGHAACLVLGKFPELQGVFGYWVLRRHTLIEYK